MKSYEHKNCESRRLNWLPQTNGYWRRMQILLFEVVPYLSPSPNPIKYAFLCQFHLHVRGLPKKIIGVISNMIFFNSKTQLSLSSNFTLLQLKITKRFSAITTELGVLKIQLYTFTENCQCFSWMVGLLNRVWYTSVRVYVRIAPSAWKNYCLKILLIIFFVFHKRE